MPQVVGVAQSFVSVWELAGALLSELDVLLSFAEAAAVAPTPYVRPEMLGPDEGVIELRGCRHPCVEVQVGGEGVGERAKEVERVEACAVPAAEAEAQGIVAMGGWRGCTALRVLAW